MALLVSNVDLVAEDQDPRAPVAARIGVDPSAVLQTDLVRKSLDARHGKQRWRAVYRVEVTNEDAVLRREVPGVRRWTDRDGGRYGTEEQAPIRRAWPTEVRPVVVGAGPAGLFAALYLAEAGADVLLLERGGPTEARVTAVNGHWRRRAPLDPENNIVFGEGGAGTFSDGKIYTRRRDGELGFIFRRLVDFGADPGILQEAWAHLGTDKVREVLPVLRARLIELGVEVRFFSRVDEILVAQGRAVGVRLASGEEILRGPIFVAAGHSARDSGEMLVRAGASAEPRPIAIGARIEHPQSLIDRAQYGTAERGDLPPAAYRLAWSPLAHARSGKTRQGNTRKVHTFCMCPGGVVVPAANQVGRVVVNGMSFAARRAFWANSAVIVEVTPADYGASDPLAGYRFQDRIEQIAFELGGGQEGAPAQRVVDLVAGRPSAEVPRTSYAFGVRPSDLRQVLPAAVIVGMLDAIGRWDRQLAGFGGPEAVLIAPETRTTSPVRFSRSASCESTSLPGLYPLGEGAGYGGGIISCALDGLRAARALEARTQGLGWDAGVALPEEEV